MKLRKNLPVKMLAFLLAVLCLAGCAALACFQIMEIDVLWGGEPAASSRLVHRMMAEDFGDIYCMISLRQTNDRNALQEKQLQELEERFAAKNTNLRWQIRHTGDDSLLYGNVGGELPAPAYDGYWLHFSMSDTRVCAYLWVNGDLPVEDGYKEAVLALERWHAGRMLALTAALALAWLILTVCLCVWSGWRKGHEGISLCWFHRIPGDLLLACYIFLAALLAVLFADNSYSIWSINNIPLWGQLTIAGLFGGAAAILLTSFLITFCARCKGGVILRNMLTVRILLWLYRTVRNAVRALPLVWKTALAALFYLGATFLLWVIALNNGGAGWVLIWAFLSLLALCYLLWWAHQWKLLRKGTREILGGNTSCRIENGNMPPDLRKHADELNNLGKTISAAVEDRMRSEHFKAELITNVSHDLKTPLTSIISYVDLLKKEDIANPRAAEYIEVLDRKSQRLKKLTEDLVEASKASTGNLAVNAERLDLVQLADQALAEYQERLESRRLSIVRTLPAEPVWVRADGRHLWRVVDNLLSNCAKYSLEGTRVYAEVERFADCAELRIKNISREALNVDPDTLMERFVRGDESRTTEGSGLGLSIARSLTDLQEGSFKIDIDGDLFKATVRLPLAE